MQCRQSNMMATPKDHSGQRGILRCCAMRRAVKCTLRWAMMTRSLADIFGWTMKWTFLSLAGLCCVRMTLKFCSSSVTFKHQSSVAIG